MTLKCYRCGEWPCTCKDGQTIVHGDCREVLPLLPKVDLVLTDPPYGIGYVTARRSRSDKLRVPVANDTSLSVVAEAWPLAMERLADERHWYAFASPAMIPDAKAIFGGKQLICWDKGDRGTVGDLECGFGEAWEAIFFGLHNGRRALNGKRPRTMVRLDWSSTMDPVHPTVKPVALLEKLINWSTNEGELVLDPFMGSGTTLAAAKKLGRRAIGIELEDKYCHAAANRLRQNVLDFGEAS